MRLARIVFVGAGVWSLAVLYGQSRISGLDAQAAIPDLALGVLFVAAFVKTGTVVKPATE